MSSLEWKQIHSLVLFICNFEIFIENSPFRLSIRFHQQNGWNTKWNVASTIFQSQNLHNSIIHIFEKNTKIYQDDLWFNIWLAEVAYLCEYLQFVSLHKRIKFMILTDILCKPLFDILSIFQHSLNRGNIMLIIFFSISMFLPVSQDYAPKIKYIYIGINFH